jgi:hypothetical protein
LEQITGQYSGFHWAFKSYRESEGCKCQYIGLQLSINETKNMFLVVKILPYNGKLQLIKHHNILLKGIYTPTKISLVCTFLITYTFQLYILLENKRKNNNFEK